MKDIYSPLEIDEQWDQRAPAAVEAVGTSANTVLDEQNSPDLENKQNSAANKTLENTTGAYTFYPDQENEGNNSAFQDNQVRSKPEVSAAGAGAPPNEPPNWPPNNPEDNKIKKDELIEKVPDEVDNEAIEALSDNIDNSNDKESSFSQHPAGMPAEASEEITNINSLENNNQEKTDDDYSLEDHKEEKVIEPSIEDSMKNMDNKKDETIDTLAPESTTNQVESTEVKPATSVAVETTVAEISRLNERIATQIEDLKKAREQKETAKQKAESEASAIAADIDGIDRDIAQLERIRQSNQSIVEEAA